MLTPFGESEVRPVAEGERIASKSVSFEDNELWEIVNRLLESAWVGAP